MTGRFRRRRRETTRALAGPRAEKTVSLALQGGGAHGAFRRGDLERLFERGMYDDHRVHGCDLEHAPNARIGRDDGHTRGLLYGRGDEPHACRVEKRAPTQIEHDVWGGRDRRNRVLERIGARHVQFALHVDDDPIVEVLDSNVEFHPILHERRV